MMPNCISSHGPWSLLKATILLCHVVLLQGEVIIEIASSSPAKTGDRVMIKCSLRNFYSGDTYDISDPSPQDDTCHIVWSRSYYTSSHGQLYQEALVNNDVVVIKRTEDEWNRPLTSTVTLHGVDTTADGIYKCSVVCRSRIESASLKLQVNKEGWSFWSSDGSTMVSAVITVTLVFLILVVAVCLATKPHCCSKFGASSVETAASEDTESTLLGSVASDPPPRYSIVINTSQCPVGSRCSIDDLNLQRRLSHTGSIDSVFFVPLTNAPPNYSAALMDLAEKGVIFNPESVKPMPPSYKDALQFPLKNDICTL